MGILEMNSFRSQFLPHSSVRGEGGFILYGIMRSKDSF